MTSLSSHPLLRFKPYPSVAGIQPLRSPATQLSVKAFQRGDFDRFAKRVTSGDAWKDVWRGANDGFEQLLFDARKAAERLDRRYSLSRRLSSVARSASDRARLIDRDFEISNRWRTLSLDFSRNWPGYRKQLSDFLDTPLGRSCLTIGFLWFALSGWLFRIFIFSIWVLPFAGPLLIGTIANNFVVQGSCPACKRQFVGYKNQAVRCAGCGNTVWQPKGDFFSKGPKSTKSKSEQDIIDVEYEEK
ncbi:hypothetical protein V2J09_008429 [Rumex salicifolius]